MKKLSILLVYTFITSAAMAGVNNPANGIKGGGTVYVPSSTTLSVTGTGTITMAGTGGTTITLPPTSGTLLTTVGASTLYIPLSGSMSITGDMGSSNASWFIRQGNGA